MRRNFFVILGQEGRKGSREAGKPVKRGDGEPNLDILKESPCLRCELFVEATPCPYVKGCSKIDEFQQVAAAHRTLCKFQDIHSIVKI